jgi:folylpolyglutamate synthase/dihydropteroate synthase
VWVVPLCNVRGASVSELLPVAAAAGYSAVYDATVEKALMEARSAGGPVLVTGSLFLAGEVLALLEGKAKPLASVQ